MAKLFILCAVNYLASGAAAPSNSPFFAYYSANLSATPWVSLFQADTVGDAAAAFSSFKVPSMLLLYDALFTTIPGRMILRADFSLRLQALLAQAAPLLSSGAILGLNLGDELVWNCLSQDNLTVATEAVRAACPRGQKGCLVWYNEAAVFRAGAFKDSCGNANDAFRVPPGLDWFSVDIYHMDGIVQGWVQEFVAGFYSKYIFPLLSPGQKAVLVPGSYGSDVNHYPNGTYVCDRACYDAMIAHDAAEFHAWATADTRIAAVMPWNWNGCPSCNGSRWTPPHTCCMDELGTKAMPQAAAAWKALFG